MSRIIAIASLSIFIFINYHLQAQENKYVKFDKQEIVLQDFKADGLILDIGGGGEGVIGQLKRDQVISIDIYKDELENAPSTNLKIVMDARDMKFLDNSFNTVTIFYTLMYIKGKDHEKVFKEVKRVMKNGGKLLIWDVNLPVWKDTTKKGGLYEFKFNLPKTEINTGYGAYFPKDINHDMDYYLCLAKNEGFIVINQINTPPSFYLELQKTPLLSTPSIIDTLQQIIANNGIQDALKAYKQIKQNRPNDYSFEFKKLEKLCLKLYLEGKVRESVEIVKLIIQDFNLNEETINQYGYEYLNDGKYNEAIEIFIMNTKKYPQSANAFNSLAEAYMKAGKTEPAIENFKKSLELNPKNNNAKKILESLN